MRAFESGLALVLLAVVACSSVDAQRNEAYQRGPERPEVRFEKVAGRMAEALNQADYKAARQDFARVMHEALPPVKANEFFKNLMVEYGRIRRLGSVHLVPPRHAVIPAYCRRGVMDIKIVLDDEDKIIGLWFTPHRLRFPAPEEHETPLSLPFRGRWLVFAGGDTKELNHHHDTPNQRFAFDFTGADEKGRTRKGNGLSNDDYFAFGREVLAPGDGIVTDVIGGVRDNEPGSMNPYSALGNAVFIRHRSNEVSVLAHLKLGSIRVKVGESVKSGRLIGLCGNSGNSSEPHLHYHLQNTAIIQDGTGIKCRFRNIEVITEGRSERKESYSPVKGEIVVGLESETGG